MTDEQRASTTWQALTCMLLSTVILSAMIFLMDLASSRSLDLFYSLF